MRFQASVGLLLAVQAFAAPSPADGTYIMPADYAPAAPPAGGAGDTYPSPPAAAPPSLATTPETPAAPPAKKHKACKAKKPDTYPSPAEAPVEAPASPPPAPAAPAPAPSAAAPAAPPKAAAAEPYTPPVVEAPKPSPEAPKPATPEPYTPPVVEAPKPAPSPKPAASPAPAAPAPAPPTYGGNSPTSGGKPMIQTVNEYRARAGLPAQEWDAGLASSAAKTGEAAGGRYMAHKMHPGTRGQVLIMGTDDKATTCGRDLKGYTPFEAYYLSWLCENPSDKGIQGHCPKAPEVTRTNVEGQIGHWKLLSDPKFKKIGCAFTPNPGAKACDTWNGVWACDLA